MARKNGIYQGLSLMHRSAQGQIGNMFNQSTIRRHIETVLEVQKEFRATNKIGRDICLISDMLDELLQLLERRLDGVKNGKFKNPRRYNVGQGVFSKNSDKK